MQYYFKASQCFTDKNYNQFHNILRLFDVLPNFPFITSETIGDYYLWTCYIRDASRVAERLKTYDLRKLGNIRKVSKFYRVIPSTQYPAPPKMKALLILAGNSWKQKLNFSRCALFYMKTRVSLKYFVSYCGSLISR